jgi:hypothetical protein
LRNLAASCRSRRLHDRAAGLWNTILNETTIFHEEVYEGLSVHYEHREKDLEKALELTERAISQVRRKTALARWKHRRQRLIRKISKDSSLFHLAT